ncbi:MAG TPA: hypothetical protein PKI44_04250 [Candidatus Omnitrophota bacterium]|nr:hypothetical protein [Candidatus Omnitrophota bacterium]
MDKVQTAFKRKVYLIDKEFQNKFILKFCLLILLVGFTTIATLYLLAMRSTTVAIVNSRVTICSTADFLLPMLIQTVIVIVIISGIATFFVTLLFSHKIAGPLYRFKKAIESIKEGNLNSNFHLRDYDQLHSISDEMNAMIDKTRQQVDLIKNDVANLKTKKGNISEQDIEELDTKVNYFKT